MNQAQSRFRDILRCKLHRDDRNKGQMKHKPRQTYRGNSDQIQGAKLKNTAGFCVASGAECAADRGSDEVSTLNTRIISFSITACFPVSSRTPMASLQTTTAKINEIAN